MESFFPTPPQYAGIEINGENIRFALLKKTRKGWNVTLLKELNTEKDVNLLYNQINNSVLVSTIPSREVLVRHTEIQLQKPKDIFSALDFHVEPLLPYAVEDAVIQAQITHKQEKWSEINVFSVRKDHLSKYLERMKAHAIEPEIVTCRSYALAAFSTLLPLTSAPLLLVYEAEEEIILAFVEKGILLAKRAFDRRGDIEEEMHKTLLSFSSTHKKKQVEHVYFIGKDRALREVIEKVSDKQIEPLATPSLPLTIEELTTYGMAIGTALAYQGPNFRQKEFAYPHRFKQIKKPLFGYFTLSALLVGALFGFSQIALSQKKQAIQHNYLSLIKAEGKNLDEVSLPETSLAYLSSLNKLEEEIHARPDTFPLLPRVPKMKEVLSWLTTEQLKNKHEIEIDQLHYTMVKRPDFSHKKERYKVKVELEFTTQDPVVAKAFHEMLKGSNAFVDSNEEVQWSSGRGKYHTSFYLKDKTHYS